MSSFSRVAKERVLRFAKDDLQYYLSNPAGNDMNAEAFGVYVGAIEFQLEKESTMDDEKNVTHRSPLTEGEAGWYCVIGPNVTQNHPIKRSWKTDQEAAAKHAEKLITDSFDGHRTKTKRLLVVKVVEVIEIAGPPITRRTASAITSDDVGDTSEEE